MAIDIMEAFSTEPPVLDFIFGGFLAGSVGALVAPGATGKSFFMLEGAMAIACPMDGGDLLALKPAHTGRVVYLAGEDPAPVLVRRIHAIGGLLPTHARAAIAEGLVIEPVCGQRLDIMSDADLQRVISLAAGARLLIFDTLARFHKLDENSNSDMARLVAALEHIAASTGAAVLFLHHVSKGSVGNGSSDQQQAARGASALIDNARWAANLARMSEAESNRLSESEGGDPIGGDRRGFFVRYSVSKNNYGMPAPDRWFQRQAGGVLVPVGLLPAKRGDKGGRSYANYTPNPYVDQSAIYTPAYREAEAWAAKQKQANAKNGELRYAKI